MKLTDTNLREKDFHNKLHGSGEARSQNKYYKALYNLFEDFLSYLEKKTPNKNVLDFGCGNGVYAEKVVKFNPSQITAIDISEKAIEIAKSKNLKKIEYIVENCENTKLTSNNFDLIYGTGILHHLNLKKSLTEIERLLKNGGSLIFIEPLGTNPFINFYRKLTPSDRSKDEHPFTFSDIKYFESLFAKVKVSYYGFFTLLFLPLYKSPKNSILFNILNKMDKFFLKIPFFKFFAWAVLIEAKKS